MFDGKIGLWPLAETYVAMRGSVKRKKGTICSRNVASVDRPLHKHYIIEEVIPAIKAKWPASERGRTIYIQQDNATPHVSVSEPDVVAAGTSDGWNIRLLFQPPNSPDLNVLDLRFFALIQCIQYRQQTRGIQNLIRAVTVAFEETSTTTLDNIFLTLQCVIQCILLNEGGNRYPLPHIGKEVLRKKGFADRDHVRLGGVQTGCAGPRTSRSAYAVLSCDQNTSASYR
ncbi:hypothetical protein PC128_g4254 [Phytophthora cactorum]|nr:hypothetical protein PC128_g4254 [Phytophthora cactorum]